VLNVNSTKDEYPTSIFNASLRRKIVEMVVSGKNGHIPSAFSILDIVAFLYEKILNVRPTEPDWAGRDYFILSKGHGCLALYVVLHKHGFLTDLDIEEFCRPLCRLGEHPDATKVPGAEASSGSLGHGLSYSVGIALGLRILARNNKVLVLIGDGESHEGTVWEAAHVARNLQLGQLCVIVDWNQSGMQLLPIDNLPAKWEAFGWKTIVVDGHNPVELEAAFDSIKFQSTGIPTAIIARTIKGKGVRLLEGHGSWHHRIPNEEEKATIMRELG
jgi:transketolase